MEHEFRSRREQDFDELIVQGGEGSSRSRRRGRTAKARVSAGERGRLRGESGTVAAGERFIGAAPGTAIYDCTEEIDHPLALT